MASKRPTTKAEYVKPKTNLEKAQEAMPTSYLAKIIARMNMLTIALIELNPDAKHNTGRLIGEHFMWDQIAKYAKAMSDKTWKELEDQHEIDTEDLVQGDHLLVQVPHFVITASASAPVKRFNGGKFVADLKEKYKIPEIVTKELLDKAKVGTKSSVTIKVVEKANI